MTIDRYFNPEENTFTVSSSIIQKLQAKSPQRINDFLSEMYSYILIHMEIIYLKH